MPTCICINFAQSSKQLSKHIANIKHLILAVRPGQTRMPVDESWQSHDLVKL